MKINVLDFPLKISIAKITLFLLFALNSSPYSIAQQQKAPKSENVCSEKEVFLDDCSVRCEAQCPGIAPSPGCAGPIKSSLCTGQACQCRDEFARASNGSCIKSSDCPPSGTPTSSDCPANETMSKCSPFQPLCVNKCECQYGFYRCLNEKCLAPKDCTAISALKCTVNETQTRFKNCDPLCSSPGYLTCDPVPYLNIVSTNCHCRPGFARNSSNSCVEYLDCPTILPNCSDNEVRIDDSVVCESHCSSNPAQPQSTPVLCVATAWPINATKACQCAPGFVRNLSCGGCIHPEECPSLDVQSTKFDACSENETRVHYKPCDRVCGQTGTLLCPLKSQLNECTISEELVEKTQYCTCKDGFVRGISSSLDKKTNGSTIGKCIRELDCPKDCNPLCLPPSRCEMSTIGPKCVTPWSCKKYCSPDMGYCVFTTDGQERCEPYYNPARK